jgi:two-component system sensor histidine kinase KdpD
MLNEETRFTGQLKESERLHQTILDSISHEIRTPLTAIIGASTALQDDKIAQSIDTRSELIRELIDASERLNLVVENLLDTSRLNSGMLKLKQEWCDPKDIISVTLESLDKTLKSHKIEISTDSSLPLIFVDFHLIAQVLSNLIRNAAVATPTGGVIRVESKSTMDSFDFVVMDSGPGIPDDTLGKVFERFYRIAGTPTGGTGLGLWLAKNIIELHGGKISVHNRTNGGAVFTILLPLNPQPESPPEGKNDSNS